MDLHAILNASDSSDDDELSNGPLQQNNATTIAKNGGSSYYYSNNAAASGTYSSSSNQRYNNIGSVHLDLEQILNEDETSDESDEFVSDTRFTKLHNKSINSQLVSLASSYRANPSSSSRAIDNIHTTYKDISYGSTDKKGSIYHPSRLDRNSTHTASSRNPEDWAVLQAILVEDDDETDDMSDDGLSRKWIQNKSVVFENSSSRQTQQRQPSSTIKATELILDDDDDDDDMDFISTLTSNRSQFTLSKQNQQIQSENFSSSNYAILNQSNQNALPFNDPRRSTNSLNSVVPSVGSTQNDLTFEDRDFSNNDVSKKAFEFAMNAERKLLKSGHREIVSPLMVKRRLKPKIELSARGAVKKNGNLPNNKNLRLDRLRGAQSSVASRFNFSGVVENKTMTTVSKQIVKHADPTISKVLCGLPTCLAFNSKFIAIGTQLGIILIFDLFEVLRQRLGASAHDENWQGGKAVGSITSIDLSQNGEAVIAGYTSGMLVLWDTIRGVVLKSVNDSHMSPITSVRFLNELKVVAVDAGGLVNKLTFSKNLIWSNYSAEPECLLDGTAGQILAMSVLPSYQSVKTTVRPTAFSRPLGKLTLMALSSERSSFVVAVDPKVNVLHRWARPPSDRTDRLVGSEVTTDGTTYLPCLSWGWALTSGGGNVAMPTLARAWGCCLQLLCASFPTLDEFDAGSEPIIHWPAFGVQDEVDATTPIVAIDWLNERTLVYLTETNELTIVDTVMMTLLERLDFAGVNLVFAEFSLSRGIRKENSIDEDTASCMVYQNSTRCSDDRLLVLCQDELLCISIVGARRRISTLEADGEWLEALAFALDHYESTVLSQEDRKRDPTARKDLSRHPEFSAARSDEEEWIAKLLMRYLNLAVENAPDSVSIDPRHPNSPGGQKIDLAQSHYQMLCGVACEFCLSIRRIDLLFGPIFRKFQSVGYINVFLDVLEPYVLNDKLSYIAPEVMSLFVEHCKITNGISTVERCLLHMDCTIMDFDSILSLLRKNEMYTALFYVFNQGLDDYVTPIEILLEKVFDEADSGATLASRDKGGVLGNDFERLGYKAIVYLQNSFEGRSFPREKVIEPEERQHSLKVELLNFVTQLSFSPSPHVAKTTRSATIVGCRALKYPYLRLLLQVDPWCTLDAIKTAFDSIQESSSIRTRAESLDDWVDGGSVRDNYKVTSLQTVIDVLSAIVLPQKSKSQSPEQILLKPKGTVDAFLEFAAKFLINGAIVVDKPTTFMILRRKSNQFAMAKSTEERKEAQQQIMALMSSLTRNSYDPDKVLEVFKQTKMHRAALLLHQQVASAWQDNQIDDIELRTRHFLSAIDCYLGDDDKSFRKEVFQYIKKECSGVNENLELSDEAQPKTLRGAVYRRLSALVHLDALMTARLVADLFAEEMDQVINALPLSDGGEGQFLFLQAVISGVDGHVDPVVNSVLNVTVEHHQKYLSLLARLHPEMVYEYLSTHDTYRNEESLRLCQQYDIADASAYLLERMGNVSSALQLILQTLESRLMGLKRTMRGLGLDSLHRHSSVRYSLGRPSSKSSNETLSSQQQREVEGVTRILVVALDVCERNSGPSSSSGSEKSKFAHGELWFNVLDRLINAKGFLRLSKEQPEQAKMMGNVLSDLLRLTMQRMVSSVPLTDLVRKVTSDHSSSRIGELREMVESLLATYGFELKVFQSAVAVFHNDAHGMQQKQFDMRVKGSCVNAIMDVSLDEVNQDTAGGVMDMPFHPKGLVSIGSSNNARYTQGDRVSKRNNSDTGLVTALSRLRRRRQSDGIKADFTRSSGELNMMTTTEQLYKDSEIEPVVYERFSGLLGDAEHRGRLMMFY